RQRMPFPRSKYIASRSTLHAQAPHSASQRALRQNQAPPQPLPKQTKNMWTCPRCRRPFRTTNQSHTCSDLTVDDIFADKPDDLLLAFDDILVAIMAWEPNVVGAAKKAIVFTNKRAWLIVRPMSKQLDVAFYTDGPLVHPKLHKSAPYMKGKTKHRHQVRLSGPGELNTDMVDLLRKGFDYGMR
ncbi:MAG: DUF5655 domain-containing protein, partial [Bacteroidota bacterium]